MITTAQFVQWLKDQASRVTLLAELRFAYQSVQNVVTGLGYLSVPAANINRPAVITDSPNNSITGDIEVQIDFSQASYAATTPTGQMLMRKGAAAPVRAIQLLNVDGGTLRWASSNDGTNFPVIAVATVTLPSVGIAAGTRFILKVKHKMNNGAGGNDVSFWYSLNGGVDWSQLGSTVTTAGTTSLFDSSSDLWLGDDGTGFPSLAGHKFYSVKIYSGFSDAGGTLMQSVDFTNKAAGAASVADNVSGSWAVGIDSTVVGGAFTGMAPTEGTIYISDVGYTSKPTDTPPNQRYRSAIVAPAPDITRSIDVAKLGGRGTLNQGTLTLSNADGSLDFLLEAILDGRDISFYMGDQSWARADFVPVSVASIMSVTAPNNTQITLPLRSKNVLLDATIVGSTILVGPNAGKPKPILLGYVNNFDATPYLIDNAALTYYINDFALSLPFQLTGIDVRDSGVSLSTLGLFGFSSATMTANAATDTLSFTAHGLAANDVVMFRPGGVATMFAGLNIGQQYWVINPTTNTFQLAFTRGGAAVDITGTVMTGTFGCDRRRFYIDAINATLQLSAAPAGRVTMDMLALDAGGDIGTAAHPHSLFRYVLKHYTSLTTANYDSAAIAALETIETPTRYAGVVVLDRRNVMDVLDDLAVVANSWYSWTVAGVLTVGKLDLQNLDSVTSIDTITKDDMPGEPSCENSALQFGRIIYDAAPNVVTQTDGLAAGVAASDRSKWTQPYQTRVKTTDPAGSDYPNDWWNYHRTGIDSAPLETRMHEGGFPGLAQAACDERTELFRPWTRVFKCTVGLDKYALNAGDAVLVKYPRYGLTAGKNFRVISTKLRPLDRAIDLVLARRTIPDYATTSHA